MAVLYEQLRRGVIDGGRGGPGCALLQREGMKSWIQAGPRRKRPSVKVCAPGDMVTTSNSFCGDLVQLIAVMVLEIHQQGAIS
jgi:hypothetical protein